MVSHIPSNNELPPPLKGIRVVDATHIVAGPFCSMLLGDAGAEVIKVERPGTGERGRYTRPFITSPSGEWVSSRYLTVNRNKQSISLDLTQPKGKAIFEQLVRVSDVVLDNWGPGAMRRLGYDYKRLSQLNPSVVYASISGYGDDDEHLGPYSDWASNNPCAQAMGGWMEITGSADGPPQMVGDNIGDSVPALWTAYGIMLALETRRQTGLGQHVDMSMYDCMVAHNTSTLPVYQVSGKSPGRERETMVSAQLTLKASDGYVVLAGAGDEDKWVSLWNLIGRPELVQDPRYLGRDVTGQFFTTTIQPLLEEWSMNIPKKELAQTLLDLGYSAAMVQNSHDLVNCPHLEVREMWSHFDEPVAGRFIVPSNPVKLSRVANPPVRRPPMLGEHNVEVLCGLLGIGQDKLGELAEEGVV